MNWKERLFNVLAIPVGILIGLLILNWAKAEPFPEYLKEHPQIMQCYEVTKRDGTWIINHNKTWILTWGMAKEWYENEDGSYTIVFVDPKTGRVTKIPTPENYTCREYKAIGEKEEE